MARHRLGMRDFPLQAKVRSRSPGHEGWRLTGERAPVVDPAMVGVPRNWRRSTDHPCPFNDGRRAGRGARIRSDHQVASFGLR